VSSCAPLTHLNYCLASLQKALADAQREGELLHGGQGGRFSRNLSQETAELLASTFSRTHSDGGTLTKRTALNLRPLSGIDYGFEEESDCHGAGISLKHPASPSSAAPGITLHVPASSETDPPPLPASEATTLESQHIAATAELMAAWGDERDRADRLATDLALAQQVGVNQAGCTLLLSLTILSRKSYLPGKN
jgi:hypothetical protein